MRSDLEVWRTGQFQFKQIVSDLLTEVISGAIDRAEEYIEKTKLVTFNYGELQMHSILIPSIVEQVDSFILEYPIVRKRGRQNHLSPCPLPIHSCRSVMGSYLPGIQK